VLAVPADDPHRFHEPTGEFIMGTPLYLAPELAHGERPGPRSDLYSVGAVLYHLLAGRPPFEGDDPTEVVARHVHEPVEPIERLVPGLPAMLSELVHRCLEKAPAKRPADAAELMGALDGCTVELTWGRGPAPSIQRASVPAVPQPGIAAEWARFADIIERDIATCWQDMQRPSELDAALEWVHAARDTLRHAAAEAAVRRERADVRARQRIAAQSRLDAQLRQVGAALGAAREGLRDAGEVVERAEARRGTLDEAYRRAVEELRALGSGPVGAVDPRAFPPIATSIREVLAARNEADQQLGAARDSELRLVEELASLLAEQAEIEHAATELALQEQDEGNRLERLAHRAGNAALAAQRAFENACLRLYMEYVERATPARVKA
jgi:hypothetical protein